jgi:23S rRNA pseudouridine2604 synthase
VPETIMKRIYGNKPITERFIERMGNGIPILDTVTRKCKVEQISKDIFKIVLTQGLKSDS